MQGESYASNPSENSILSPKQAKGNHLDPNERFWSQNMWGKSFEEKVKELYKPSQQNPLEP